MLLKKLVIEDKVTPKIEILKKDEKVKVKPFVKWAGGKGQLLNEIRKRYPEALGDSINKYVEPFIGGGAVLFDVLSNYNIKDVYISDVNFELINCYKTIKDDCDNLIELLELMKTEYMSSLDQKDYYYQKRERFNLLKLEQNVEDELEKASLFIFLNKTCFNGLYRVNKKGGFNVPMGSYKNPNICDKENLTNISKALKNVTIHCASYEKSIDFIDENTFVYFDPPYRPLTDSSSFTAYTEFEFNDAEQSKLADFIEIVTDKNAKIILSNSDPKNINSEDNFFDDLYSSFNIDRVQATRMINSKSDARGKINELIITNTEV